MATPVLLPKLDMTMTQGTLTRWHKREGDPVAVGDLLFEVEADKLTMDIEANAAGVLRGVACPGGTSLPVGSVVAYILAEGEALPPAEGPAPAAPAAPADTRVRATPAARRVAADLHVELSGLTGTGPGGRILRADVERAAAGAPAQAAVPAPVPVAPAPDAERVALTGARSVIARRMAMSWQQAPHVTLTLEASCTALVRLRSNLAETGFKSSYNTLISFLTARSLTRFPMVNATWDEGGELLRSRTVHLAVAVDSPGGLLVPVLRDADRLGLDAFAQRLADLVNRAKNGGLTPAELSGGTFTLSNLGGFGIEVFTPIINPPQAAILGVGAIVDKVVPVNGVPEIQPRMVLSLSFDHRAMDGADGARFLAHLRSVIECPERALL